MSGYNSKKRKASGRSTGNGRTSGGHSGRIADTPRGFPIPTGTTGASTRSGDSSPYVIPPGKDVSGLGFTGLPATSNGQAVENWLSWLYTFQGRDGYNFDTLLSSLGAKSNNPLISLLGALAFNQGGDIKESQAADWNKQLLDQILSYVNTLDDRNYKKGVLDEQRLYDNPQNQLARLMGAGISRDAALQLLGQGNEPFAADAAAVPAGVAPSESQSNFANSASALAGIAFSAVNGLAGLVNMGISVAQAKQQIEYMKNQNYLTRSQVQSYESAGEAYSILHNAGSPAESFGSLSSASKALTALAESGNQDAVNFLAAGGLDKMKRNASFASNTLATLYRSERSSKDYAREYTASMRKLEAEGDLAELKFDQLAQEISNAEATYREIENRADYYEALAAATEALGLESQSKAEWYASRTRAQEFENQATEALYGTSFNGQSYLSWRSNGVITKLVTDAQIAAKTTNPEYAQKVYEEMFNSAESVAAALSLAAFQDQEGLKFAKEHPIHFELWNGLQKCGAYDYLNYKVKANTAGHVKLPFGIGWSNTGESLFDPFGVPKLP